MLSIFLSFVHPTDSNWPGRKYTTQPKAHPSSNTKAAYSGNKRDATSPPRSRYGPPLLPQEDLFRTCKQEDEGDDSSILARISQRDSEKGIQERNRRHLSPAAAVKGDSIPRATTTERERLVERIEPARQCNTLVSSCVLFEPRIDVRCQRRTRLFILLGTMSLRR